MRPAGISLSPYSISRLPGLDQSAPFNLYSCIQFPLDLHNLFWSEAYHTEYCLCDLYAVAICGWDSCKFNLRVTTKVTPTIKKMEIRYIDRV